MRSALLIFCFVASASSQRSQVQGANRKKEGSRLRNYEFMASQGEREVMDIIGDGLGSMTASPLPPGTVAPATSSPVTASPATASPATAIPATASPATAPPVTATPTPLTLAPAVPTTTPPATSTPVIGPPVSAAPTVAPAPTPANTTAAPTSSDCRMSEEDRVAGILARLDAVADPDKIRDHSFPQGLATTWLLEETGQFRVCPQDDSCTLIQRWALAVMYFSTGGPEWFQCSANPAATDPCGTEDPFVGDSRFLSDTSECDWAGISCIQGCVTEVEFEKNNLVGTIATEIGLLKELRIWGMEQGGLTGPIPTQIGELSKLTFIDLDFNMITGSLSTQLLSLRNLTQLDLNDNRLTGSVNGIGVFPRLEFLQLHKNMFTGTIPESLGQSTRLAAFTLHETDITGTMPQSVCNLLKTEGKGGVLTSLIADCSPPNPQIACSCCTDCRRDNVG